MRWRYTHARTCVHTYLRRTLADENVLTVVYKLPVPRSCGCIFNSFQTFRAASPFLLPRPLFIRARCAFLRCITTRELFSFVRKYTKISFPPHPPFLPLATVLAAHLTLSPGVFLFRTYNALHWRLVWVFVSSILHFTLHAHFGESVSFVCRICAHACVFLKDCIGQTRHYYPRLPFLVRLMGLS